MTRTARAAYPRAVIHDRHDSRSGLDTSLRKSGAGQHNWGSIANERELESAAFEDEIHDEEEVVEAATENISSSPTSSEGGKPEITRSTSSLSDDELEKARQFRKNAFKKTGEIDLTAIARTSAAVSTSPPLRDDKITRSTSAGL
ncbi:unnamed protein product [Cyclocybe aegerita]|uniref:Hyaluronan/mRNA-binding protein domain-containing protein n=1 Tax=Cyclocybe aegerita TaxID=1973307 RepID=A0A8S0WDV6_CYCAE|nr:unnamed protein product [Cyclocybe aegerita]